MTANVLHAEIRRDIPASLEAVDGLIASLRELLAARSLGRERFAAELVAREVLTNAVLHGAHADASQPIRCVFRLRPGRAILAVSDGGAGFDWRQCGWPRAGSGVSGRGLDILWRYATRVRFNQVGNRVVLILQVTTQGESE
jgi:anti-sigma regulatory factor (Ser/Thr protein kinase)